jgi:micrococcal nuclease
MRTGRCVMKETPGWLSSNWQGQARPGKVLMLMVALVLAACSYSPPPTATPTGVAASPRAITSGDTATPAPTATATRAPSATPTLLPTDTPTATPTVIPTDTPTATPTPIPTETLLPTPEGTLASVSEVVDGDTIGVTINGQSYRLRYIGIDSPEPGEPRGIEAQRANTELVLGQTVLLEKDVSETDRYGRLLRYVWVGDMMVNAELVRIGWARAQAYPPDTRYHELFVRLEREAREAQRGLWAPQPEATTAAGPEAVPCPYIGNRNSKKFHHHWCSSVNQMKESNKVCLQTRDQATAAGYVPCKRCNP